MKKHIVTKYLLFFVMASTGAAYGSSNDCKFPNLPMKDPEAGIRSCSDALKRDPKGGSFNHYMVRGILYQNQKQYGKALDDFTEAIKRDQKWGIGYFYRAITYDLMDKKKDAIADIRKYIQHKDKGRNNKTPYLERIKSQIQVEENGRRLFIHGTIRIGLAEEFRKRVKKYPLVDTVRLQGTGGQAGVAEQIIRIIKEKKLSTYVTHNCSSICTEIFASGNKRYLHPKARLGFHMGRISFADKKFNEWRNSNQSLADIKDALPNLAQLGVSDVFFRKLKNTPYYSMWYPETSILLKEKIATDIRMNSYKKVISKPILSDHYLAVIEKLLRKKHKKLAIDILNELLAFDPLNLRAQDYKMRMSVSGNKDSSFSVAFRILQRYSLTHRALFSAILPK